MKNILIVIFWLIYSTVFSQIGIGTPIPQYIFHIDSRGNNSTTNPPNAIQITDDVWVDNNGNLNFLRNANTLNNKLYFNLASGPTTEIIRIEGIKEGNKTNDSFLGAYRPATTVGYVKRLGSINSLSIPHASYFVLENDIENFLEGVPSGGAEVIPMTLVQNPIDGLYYNDVNGQITLPSGTFQIIVKYNANHNASGCNLSSYFFDFPFSGTFTRVHNNSLHLGGNSSDHGGVIMYTTHIPSSGMTFSLNLGRGQSGNCSGKSGMNLLKDGTQLLIYRIGD
jgi:hypothetical protein